MNMLNKNRRLGTENNIISDTIKHVKMYFKVNELTEGGHIYSREILENAFNKVLKEKPFIPVTSNCNEFFDNNKPRKPYVTEIIGKFVDFTIKDNGEVVLDVKPTINTELFDLLKIAPAIIGKVGEDDKTIIEIYDVLGFFIAQNKDKVIERK